MAKVLNSSKLLSRIPERPTNCKNSLRTVRISSDLHELSTSQTQIQIFVDSWDSGPVWKRGIRDESSKIFSLSRCQNSDLSSTFFR